MEPTFRKLCTFQNFFTLLALTTPIFSGIAGGATYGIAKVGHTGPSTRT